MTTLDKRTVLLCTVFVFSIVILTVIYVYRLNSMAWSWVYTTLTVYGLLVVPFLIFSIIGAHCYRPVPDNGFRPKVSVIVPCYNDEKAIGATIKSILESDYPEDLLELVVVDDCSTDGSWEAIDGCYGLFSSVRLPVNVGKRHAVVEGLKKCTGEVVVMMDSDTTVKPDSIANLVQPFTDDNVYCVCGNAIVSNEHDGSVDSLLARFQKVWYAGAFHIRKGMESMLGVVLCCSGALSAYRRDKLLMVVDGWVNEKFFGCSVSAGDDRRLTNDMLRLGGDSVFQSNAKAYTVAPHTFRKFVRQQERWGRGSLRGMLYSLKFFYKVRGWRGQLLLYCNVVLTFLAPVALFLSFVSMAIIGGWVAVVLFFAGHMLIGSLMGLNSKVLCDYFTSVDVVFRVMFFLVMVVVTFVFLYAWLTPWKGTVWGTR